MVILLSLAMTLAIPLGLVLLAWLTEGEEVAASGVMEEGQRW